MEVEIQNGMLWRREDEAGSAVGQGAAGSPLGLVVAVSFPGVLFPVVFVVSVAVDVLAVSFVGAVVVGIGVVVGGGGVKRRPV
jgi:hypothetical protein